MNIYVGNLASTTTEEDLKEVFGKHGQINSVKIIKDFDTGQPKGFAFVEMSQKDGINAVEQLNDTELNGNNIIVNEAYERRNNNRNNNYRGGGGGRDRNSNYGRGSRY
ncbi:MAG: RNA-binding protein [Bacteroidetes bacterium]|nr:RNA-binding protein [Bacteroidota bacterium]